ISDTAGEDVRNILANAFIHDTTFQDPLGDGRANPPLAADGVDGPQMMFVSLLGGQAAVQRYPQAGTVERLLDVVRGQGVAGEEHVQVATADELADMLHAAGVDHGRTE